MAYAALLVSTVPNFILYVYFVRFLRIASEVEQFVYVKLEPLSSGRRPGSTKLCIIRNEAYM